MDIRRLRQLAGTLTESYELEEDYADNQKIDKILMSTANDLEKAADQLEQIASYMSGQDDEVYEMVKQIRQISLMVQDMDSGEGEDDEDDDMDPDYFDDLDAGDTEMDRRSDLRRGW